MKCKNNFVSLAFFNILLLFSVASCSTGKDWYKSEPLEVLMKRYNNEVDFVNSLLQNPQEMKKMILESDYYLDGVTNLRNAESTRLQENIEFTNNLDIRRIDIRNYYHRTDRKVYNDCVFLSVWLQLPHLEWNWEKQHILYFAFAEIDNKKVLLNIIVFSNLTDY